VSEQSLLEAIGRTPQEDAPRLVWADWLLERGNGWGEVVQLSVKLARATETERSARAKELAALEKRHAAAFLAPIADFVRRPRFERGLLSVMTCNAQLFALAAEGPGVGKAAARCRLPLEVLTLYGVTAFDDADAKAISQAQGLSRLLSLRLMPHGPTRDRPASPTPA
jgi:uncharacterized protein (TIGR02996 family)